MDNQLKMMQNVRSKAKFSSKLYRAADELDYFVTIKWSITQAMTRSMQDLSDGFFINVANLTANCRDSYLQFLKAGIKQVTLVSLRTARIQTSTLFLDHLITKAEEEIWHHGDKHTSGPLNSKPQHYHPYSQAIRQQ